MLRRPALEDVAEYSRRLGFTLSADEAAAMQAAVDERLFALDALDELELDDAAGPAVEFPDRQVGHKPTSDEDPLNAFIWKCDIAGAQDGPLAGKTIGMKDTMSVAGVPMTLGLKMMTGYIPDFDATIVARTLRAGGTIVGKTNLHSATGKGDFGRTLNPHNHEHVAGGSSSGSAAAVAGGCVDIAFGGDQGGSVRVPASWCGVVGLMPTWGLVPHTGIFGRDPTLDFVGPMARSTQDVAAALAVVAGPDGIDPRQGCTPGMPVTYSDGLDRGIRGTRIGILVEGFGFEGSESDVEQLVLEALEKMREAGAGLEEVSAPLHDKAGLVRAALVTEGSKRLYDTNMVGAFVKTHYPTSLMKAFGERKRDRGSEIPLRNQLNIIVGAHLDREYQGTLYAKAQNLRSAFVRQYDKLFERVDLIAMPTVPIKAPRYEDSDSQTASLRSGHYGGRYRSDLELVVRNTFPFNLTGHPAITVPCGTSQGLPIGLMLVARNFQEQLLLRAAYTYESVRGTSVSH